MTVMLGDPLAAPAGRGDRPIKGSSGGAFRKMGNTPTDTSVRSDGGNANLHSELCTERSCAPGRSKVEQD